MMIILLLIIIIIVLIVIIISLLVVGRRPELRPHPEGPAFSPLFYLGRACVRDRSDCGVAAHLLP